MQDNFLLFGAAWCRNGLPLTDNMRETRSGFHPLKNGKESSMNPVVHFEMPYVDKNRMAGFYAKAFGWQPTMMGPEMGEYVVVTTAESDEKGRPKKPGSINGGFYKKPDDPIGQHPSVVIAVTDIAQALRRIKEGGGKVLGEAMRIPGVGLYAGFLDTEGNRASVLQPASEMSQG
jgi:predicted enzyme related to lactoylglutathione lyase